MGLVTFLLATLRAMFPLPQALLSAQRVHGTKEMPFSRPQTPHKELTLGFCGLGAMGYPMARNLAQHLPQNAISFPIHVWNRTKAKSEKLLQEVGPSKIKIVEEPKDLAVDCDVVITNLANDEVVKEVYEQFAAVLKVRVDRAAEVCPRPRALRL